MSQLKTVDQVLRSGTWPVSAAEIADLSGLPYRVIGIRLSELRDRGRAKAVCTRKTRRGGHGRPIVLWGAT